MSVMDKYNLSNIWVSFDKNILKHRAGWFACLFVIVLCVIIISCDKNMPVICIPYEFTLTQNLLLGQNASIITGDTTFYRDTSTGLYVKNMPNNTYFNKMVCRQKNHKISYVNLGYLFTSKYDQVDKYAMKIVKKCNELYGTNFKIMCSKDNVIDKENEIAYLVWQMGATAYVVLSYTPDFRRQEIINQGGAAIPSRLNLSFAYKLFPGLQETDLFTRSNLGLEN